MNSSFINRVSQWLPRLASPAAARTGGGRKEGGVSAQRPPSGAAAGGRTELVLAHQRERLKLLRRVRAGAPPVRSRREAGRRADRGVASGFERAGGPSS
eukprot:SAG11_NODE_17026_length_530_cov_1.672854_2_plen_99_part_00